MAFLDNSGDIILDAVLTTLGRRRMAEGRFRITKYAFGDDEIEVSTGYSSVQLTPLSTIALRSSANCTASAFVTSD